MPLINRLLYLLILLSQVTQAQSADLQAAHRALINLTETPNMGMTLPIINDKFLFENLWWTWDKALIEKLKISELPKEQQRKTVYAHYGLLENPKNPELPLGFVRRNGYLNMNCLACHAGQVQGNTIIGLPNRSLDLRSLYNDIAILNPLAGIALKYVAKSLGPERGMVTTFGMEGIALNFRDSNMDLKPVGNNWDSFKNSSANVPPWWNLPWKTHIFADAVIPITPRIFVTSAASTIDSGSTFRNYESDVNDVFELAKSLQPPKYPNPIDINLASEGKKVFDKTCAKCHGQYDLGGQLLSYPNRVIDVEWVETDPLRVFPKKDYAKALNFLKSSWVALDFKTDMKTPSGYLAPPLLGIWATAPYLHNGSVPTLWDLLHSVNRPKIWKQSEEPTDYDLIQVGLVYSRIKKIPKEDQHKNYVFSLYYDTRIEGRSGDGHNFPDVLSEDEKVQVLEFLKLL